jgi:hypothetical protein
LAEAVVSDEAAVWAAVFTLSRSCKRLDSAGVSGGSVGAVVVVGAVFVVDVVLDDELAPVVGALDELPGEPHAATAMPKTASSPSFPALAI